MTLAVLLCWSHGWAIFRYSLQWSGDQLWFCGVFVEHWAQSGHRTSWWELSHCQTMRCRFWNDLKCSDGKHNEIAKINAVVLAKQDQKWWFVLFAIYYLSLKPSFQSQVIPGTFGCGLHSEVPILIHIFSFLSKTSLAVFHLFLVTFLLESPASLGWLSTLLLMPWAVPEVGAQPCSCRHKPSCVGVSVRQGGWDLLLRLFPSDISLSCPPVPKDCVLQPAAINPNYVAGMLGGRFHLHQA